ncbi:protein-disulfide reductase DsbD [Aquabacterium sp.]|uniref:protein-disulfide reductase DsbD n=1 Tax=Aquabacterium sp. TaxID=1872578 RepID=UPI0025B83F1C|nr:protein-disulfide reductase DsbD [Aquabacterium sp.]
MRASPILTLGRWLGLTLVIFCASWMGGLARAQTFLPVDAAFKPRLSAQGPQAVALVVQQAAGVYLYRERFEARLQASEAASEPGQPLALDLPPGQSKYDPTFDKTLEVYHGEVRGTIALPAGLSGQPVLTLVYQGCADAGICYPPQTRRYQLALDAQGGLQGLSPLSAKAAVSAVQVETASPDADTSRIQQALASGQWWLVVPAFLLAGVLLSLTPCVLPMVPILSSIIVGQKGSVGRGRGFALALAYAQGMALVYTALGVAAGLLGQGLAAYLQHPYVVLTFGALMVVLALAMFGLYELRLPAAVQSWLGEGSNRLPGGRFVSVFAMGVVSALIVSPCVSAPLAGALLYISQTRDVWLGATALYAMAWGMSLPLLLVGLSAGSLLPRTGPWMSAVKTLFGVLMLGMAVWVTRPAWPFVVAQFKGPGAVVSTHQSVLPFERVRSVAELDAAVARAAAQGKPVMLDFYADWCAACLEMEHDTFTDPAVRQRLAGAVLLQADVTANNEADRALLARFQLFGPPGLIFYSPQGQEKASARVIGFQKPADFLRSLQNAGL